MHWGVIGLETEDGGRIYLHGNWYPRVNSCRQPCNGGATSCRCPDYILDNLKYLEQIYEAKSNTF